MFHYLIITAILVVCALSYIPLAKHFNIVDKPNHRSSHKNITIRGGGIIFFIAALFFFLTTKFQYPYFFAGLTMLAVVSFIDDLISLTALLRFSTQVIACSLLLFQAVYHYNLFFLLFLLIAAVAFVNAYNFMDGINGITGIYSIAVLCSFIFIDLYFIHFIQLNLLIYVLISVIVFGFFNFRKRALFFAGDIGSISLAFVLIFAAYKLLISWNSPLVLLLFIVYGTDSLMTILKRLYLKEKISEPHRHHIYQKLTDVLKISHLKIGMLYGFIQMLISTIVIFMFNSDVTSHWIITVILLLVFAIAYIIIHYYFEKKMEKLNAY